MSDFVTQTQFASALGDIATALEGTTKVLAKHSKQFDMLGNEIDELFDITMRLSKVAVTKAPKRTWVLPVLVGVGIGIYISRDKRAGEMSVSMPNMRAKRPANENEQGKDNEQF